MAKRLSTHSLHSVRLNFLSIGAPGRGKPVGAMDCSLVASLGLSHLLEPIRLSRASSLVGWLLYYEIVKFIESLMVK